MQIQGKPNYFGLKFNSKFLFMKAKKIFIVILAFASISIASCSNDSEDDLIEVPQEDTAGTITYTANVRPIINGSCSGCHSDPPTNGAPFALTNFTQVSARANSIFNAMSRSNGASGAMPPSGRLPQSTIDIIDQWIEQGKLE